MHRIEIKDYITQNLEIKDYITQNLEIAKYKIQKRTNAKNTELRFKNREYWIQDIMIQNLNRIQIFNITEYRIQSIRIQDSKF